MAGAMLREFAFFFPSACPRTWPMHPFLADDFHVRWSQLTPEAVEPDIRHALEVAREKIREISAQDPAHATYASTYGALEDATVLLERGWGRLNHLDSVCDNPAQREALNKMLPEVSEFYGRALPEQDWTIDGTLQQNGEFLLYASKPTQDAQIVVTPSEDFEGYTQISAYVLESKE